MLAHKKFIHVFRGLREHINAKHSALGAEECLSILEEANQMISSSMVASTPLAPLDASADAIVSADLSNSVATDPSVSTADSSTSTSTPSTEAKAMENGGAKRVLDRGLTAAQVMHSISTSTHKSLHRMEIWKISEDSSQRCLLYMDCS